MRAGEAVARKRRVPSAKGFDFFVEASFLECYNEEARDLLARGPGDAAALPVRARARGVAGKGACSACSG